MTEPKPKKKRKFYGLSRNHTRRAARDFNDIDYADKLSPAEKRWLDRFCREYYQNTFTGTHRDHHNLQEMRRRCYRGENERNRDVWNVFQRTWSDLTDVIEMDPQADRPTKSHKKSTDDKDADE